MGLFIENFENLMECRLQGKTGKTCYAAREEWL